MSSSIGKKPPVSSAQTKPNVKLGSNSHVSINSQNISSVKKGADNHSFIQRVIDRVIAVFKGIFGKPSNSPQVSSNPPQASEAGKRVHFREPLELPSRTETLLSNIDERIAEHEKKKMIN